MTSSVEYTINLKSFDVAAVHTTWTGISGLIYTNASISSVFNTIAALGTGYGAKIEVVDYIQDGENGVALTTDIEYIDLWMSINGVYSTFSSSANSNDLLLCSLSLDYGQRGANYRNFTLIGSNPIYIYSVSSVAGITLTFKNAISKAAINGVQTTKDYSITLKVTPFKFS